MFYLQRLAVNERIARCNAELYTSPADCLIMKLSVLSKTRHVGHMPRPKQLILGLSFLAVLSSCATRQAPRSAPLVDTEFTGRSAPIDVQLESYVMVQEALATDNFEDARSALASLTTLADPITQPLVRSAASADDIATMRTRFKPLSEYLAALELPQGFARAYCPMYDNGSNWVQRDGPVRNPYFGSGMLTCGVVDAAPGAHMDHTPRQGGIVFMAPDSFHHIEGAYPEAGVFRLYATDNYREPVDISDWSGRVVLEEDYDANTDEFVEILAYELLPASGGEYLEASVGDVAAPAEIIAKVLFASTTPTLEDFPEERFDFIFAEYTSVTTADASPPPSTVMTGAPSSVALADRIRPPIPELTADIVTNLSSLDQELQALIDRGAFAEIFIPALQAKTLALALNDRANQLPDRQRDAVKIAVRHLVRASWLLDWYGDLGNKQQVTGAYNIFGSAANEIYRIYAENP